MKRPLCLICLLVLGFFILYQQIFPPPAADDTEIAGKLLTVTGKVSAKNVRSDYHGQSQWVVELSKIEMEGREERQKVRVYLYEEPKLGSYLKVKGKCRPYKDARNEGGFDTKKYYATLGLSFDLTGAEILERSVTYNQKTESIWQFKKCLENKLYDFLPKEDAGILTTMLLGDKSAISTELKDLFKRNGIVHILTVSGLHISILGMGLYKLLRKVGMPLVWAGGLAMGVMVCYGMMVGSSASSFRALFMFAMNLLAKALGRTYDLLTALALAAALLLWIQPLYFYHSGYLFSFASVFAIGAFLPLFQVPKWFQAPISCLCIYVVTLPVHLISYYEYPYYAFLLNLLVLPLMSILLELAVCLLGVSFVLPYFGRVLAVPIHWILTFYRFLCEGSDRLGSGIDVIGRPMNWQVILYVCLLGFILFEHARHRRKECNTRFGQILLLCCALLFLTCNFHRGFKIAFLDVGQGDCIYVRTEDGVQMLFDGGSSSVREVGKEVIVPFLKANGVKKLDYVFLSHADTDHISGVEELVQHAKEYRIAIKTLVLPKMSKERLNQEFGTLLEAFLSEKNDLGVRTEQIENRCCESGMILTEEASSRSRRWIVRCLHPSVGYRYNDTNEGSACYLFETQNLQLVLTGDITGAGELRMGEELLKYRDQSKPLIWKMAHHGSAYSTPKELLITCPANLYVISVGEGNSYGHPHEETLERLEKYVPNAEVLRTDKYGQITMKGNGRKIRIEK